MRNSFLPLPLPLLLLLGLACAPRVVSRLPANRLGRYVQKMVQEEGMAQSDWGILARNLRTGKTLISYNANKLFLPASNTKLYTTAAALRLLGPQFRFRTPLLATGPVSGGVLQGDLVIIGQGDPTWSARMRDKDGRQVFRAWADSLKDRGIQTIAGSIIGVDAVFDGVPYGSGWMWDDEPYYFAAPISGLSFNENVVDITIVPVPGEAPILVPNPPTGYVTLENHLTTLDTLNNPDSLEADWELWRDRGSNRAVLEGISPPDSTETAVTVENPMAFTATVLKETLEEQGLTVKGGVRGVTLFGSQPHPEVGVGDTLFVYLSPSLGEIIYYLNKDSQNLMAEVLLRTVALSPEEGAGATAGLERCRPVWAEMGVDTNNIVLTDGSGLSRYNKISPRSTVALLTAMQGDTSFTRSLPIAGVDGTLEDTFVGSLAEKRVFAKTGTLWGVRALSGYLINAKGDQVVFSILVNDYLTPVSEINARIERILELLITT